jgi:OOP family OmpA-OmpF porin
MPTLKEDNVGNAYDVNRNVGEARFRLGNYFGQNRDNDKDGILDVNDKCPNEAETKNGYMDEDGCPDKKPMPQFEAAGAKLVLQGVNFKTASAELLPESMEILDKVAEGLVDNPEVEIEIRGYTDNVGRVSSNQKLSEARANSVMQYLISKGVAASRMTAAGYGPKDPVAPNDTPEGRAQNRRIEFYRSK